MQSRMTPKDVVALYEWAGDHEDVYAGLSYSRDGEHVHIELFTSADPEQIAHQVRPLLDNPANVSVLSRRYSVRDLTKIVDQVIGLRVSDSGAYVSSAGPDLDRQRVAVYLSGEDELLRQELHTRFDEMIFIEAVGVVARAT
jgi:hypothetical protein